MSWRLAKSLETLRSQINAIAPNRDKKSDGTVGDLSHQARKSDHNPDANGVVRALDITHDPEGGMDCHKLAEELQKSKDKRILYVIWNGQIMSGSHSARAWVTRPYTGTNPHRHHLHISVVEEPAKYDSVTPWAIGGKPKTENATAVVNGKRVPIIRQADGTVYAPLRATCEALGATVSFDPATGAVVVVKK